MRASFVDKFCLFATATIAPMRRPILATNRMDRGSDDRALKAASNKSLRQIVPTIAASKRRRLATLKSVAATKRSKRWRRQRMLLLEQSLHWSTQSVPRQQTNISATTAARAMVLSRDSTPSTPSQTPMFFYYALRA